MTKTEALFSLNLNFYWPSGVGVGEGPGVCVGVGVMPPAIGLLSFER